MKILVHEYTFHENKTNTFFLNSSLYSFKELSLLIEKSLIHESYHVSKLSRTYLGKMKRLAR